MKLTNIMLIAAIALGGGMVSGCDQSKSPEGAATKSGQVAERDKKFVMEAAKIGIAEVAVGKLASEKGTDQVKQFGQQMVSDHKAANEKLMKMASEKGIEAPRQMDDKHQKAMDKLGGMSGASFDKEYLDGQASDHKKAVEVFEEQAKDGKDPALKQFAAETVPTLKHHLQMAQELQKKMS